MAAVFASLTIPILAVPQPETRWLAVVKQIAEDTAGSAEVSLENKELKLKLIFPGNLTSLVAKLADRNVQVGNVRVVISDLTYLGGDVDPASVIAEFNGYPGIYNVAFDGQVLEATVAPTTGKLHAIYRLLIENGIIVKTPVKEPDVVYRA
jgi:hypothetical protein